MNNTVLERILNVATELYMTNGKKSYPTVHQVRAIAKTDMNTTSEAMRQWRKEMDAEKSDQSNGSETFQKAISEATATLWSIAEHAAGENLRKAQKAWNTEKSELGEKTQTLINENEQLRYDLDLAKEINLDQAGELLDEMTYRKIAETALEEEKQKNQKLTELLNLQK
ncbi:DNA-binding protein [Pseudomonas asiatica]|uniref:DNA-binding protein n=1 Tax=Pseudomonas asiatica TaxID=2219225 RepID=UPI0025A168CE|nr:DNA-binding protein [Pseudomonas asiatica]WJM55222.1 DNA-binding protein [Pseudomonas asiatica]